MRREDPPSSVTHRNLGTVYLPVYADSHGVIERAAAEKMMPAALFVMMGAMVFSGWLADRFGGFAIFRLGYILLAVGTGPLLLLLAAGKISPHPALIRFGARVSEEGGGDVPADWAARR